MIGKTLGRYQVFEKLGAGGMGEVYRARDERLERDVALKVISSSTSIDDSTRKRFRKEALLLSKLNHPNIATILDFDTQDGLDFLVMEYILGSTLSEKVKQGPLPEKEMLHLAVQIVAALEEAHAAGVVHRDLKSANIYITPKGQAKVLDFGLAKLVQAEKASEMTQASTETGVLAGTIPFMSPEQLQGEPLDGRTDIYSFGAVLYEMATGQRTFRETQPVKLVDSILHHPPQPPRQLKPDLSPRLEEITLKCLEKDRENRYQSAKELLIDLRRMESPSQWTSPSPTVTEGKSPRIRRPYVAIAIGIVLAALAIIIGLKVKQAWKSHEQIVPIAGIQSIVALPSNVFGPEENDYLADAIPNALSTHLSALKGMETKMPPTSLEMERSGGDLNKIADAYAVNAFVSSSVSTEGDHFTLNVQLVDAHSRNLLWSQEYDGKRENYLQLVRNAADGLQQVLRPGESLAPPESGATLNTEAELLYQRGFYHLRAFANRKQSEDFDKAFADFQQALVLDPTMAPAAAAIARLYAGRLESGTPLREVLPEIDKWAYQALKLDHRCGEAWQVLSIAEEFRPNSDPRKRLEYALKAATYANSSGYSHHVLAAALSRNSVALSVAASKEGNRQEPLHLNGLLFTAGILSKQDKPKEGLSMIEKVLRIEPDMPIAVIMKFWLLLRNHQFHEAEKFMPALDKMVAERRLHPGWVDFAREWLEFEQSVASGKSEQALKRIVSTARGEAPPFPRWELVTAEVLTMQAEYDSVDSSIETLSLRAAKGIIEPYDLLLVRPELAGVRKDPRFPTVAMHSRTEFQDMLAILEEARNRNELPSYLEKPLAEAHKLTSLAEAQR